MLHRYMAPDEAEVKLLDEDKHLVEAVASTERKDRHGDIIRQKFWDMDEFLKNPVLISSHNYLSLSAIIGRWESMEVKGTKLVGVARYFVGEGLSEADRGFALARRGMAAFSVGFRPDMSKAKEIENEGGTFPNFEFRGQELLEVSQVSVPANPDARQRVKALCALDPSLASRFDDVLKATPTGRAPTMDELAEAMWQRARVDLPAMLRAVLVAGALRPHETPRADENAEWNAAVEVEKAKVAQLRRMHAWVDGDDDPDAPRSYKLAHHRADGLLVWRGVEAAMWMLPEVPEADRRGAYNHLAKHYEQFGKQPPEFEAKRSLDVAGFSATLAEAIRRSS